MSANFDSVNATTRGGPVITVLASTVSTGFFAIMVLIGTTSLARVVARSDFHCPSCRETQTGTRRLVRPWLTLYFVPVLPIGSVQTHVRCDGCQTHWDPTVVDLDQRAAEQARQAQFAAEVLRACVLTAQLAGDMTPDDIQSLGEVVDRLSQAADQPPMTRDELDLIRHAARQSKIQAADYLQTVARPWTQVQRLEALEHLFTVASAGGTLHPSQSEFLVQARDILHLTDREFRQTIEKANHAPM